MKSRDDARKNRRYWDAGSDRYQEKHRSQLDPLRHGCVWGVWSVPEQRLRALGSVRGKDVLELGCGGAQWSIALARRGARPVGLDLSERQLRHARRNMGRAGVKFPLVHGGAEAVPLPDAGFDIVFCDHGAMSFTDPRRSVPEAARLLRPGGRLAFNTGTPFHFACWSPRTERLERELVTPYFHPSRYEFEGHVEYQLPYGAWIRLFRRSGFEVEDLIEIRPPAGATTTYPDYAPLDWARRWPAEHIWVVRKREDPG